MMSCHSNGTLLIYLFVYLGKILNRFGKDFALMDESLPTTFFSACGVRSTIYMAKLYSLFSFLADDKITTINFRPLSIAGSFASTWNNNFDKCVTTLFINSCIYTFNLILHIEKVLYKNRMYNKKT